MFVSLPGMQKELEGRWRNNSCEGLVALDKSNPSVFLLKDRNFTDLISLPEPDELAEEIIENLKAGLNGFRKVLAELERAS